MRMLTYADVCYADADVCRGGLKLLDSLTYADGCYADAEVCSAYADGCYADADVWRRLLTDADGCYTNAGVAHTPSTLLPH